MLFTDYDPTLDLKMQLVLLIQLNFFSPKIKKNKTRLHAAQNLISCSHLSWSPFIHKIMFNKTLLLMTICFPYSVWSTHVHFSFTNFLTYGFEVKLQEEFLISLWPSVSSLNAIRDRLGIGFLHFYTYQCILWGHAISDYITVILIWDRSYCIHCY